MKKDQHLPYAGILKIYRRTITPSQHTWVITNRHEKRKKKVVWIWTFTPRNMCFCVVLNKIIFFYSFLFLLLFILNCYVTSEQAPTLKVNFRYWESSKNTCFWAVSERPLVLREKFVMYACSKLCVFCTACWVCICMLCVCVCVLCACVCLPKRTSRSGRIGPRTGSPALFRHWNHSCCIFSLHPQLRRVCFCMNVSYKPAQIYFNGDEEQQSFVECVCSFVLLRVSKGVFMNSQMMLWHRHVSLRNSLFTSSNSIL